MKSYSDFTDEELTALLKPGMLRLSLSFSKDTTGYCLLHAFRLSGDEEEARDIVQDVFALLWDRRAETNFTSNFSGFLYTMIRHQVFDGIAHKKVAEKYVDSIKDFFAKGEAKTDHLLLTRDLEAIIEKRAQCCLRI